MRPTKWLLAFTVGTFLLTSNFALAQDHGNGHGKVTTNMGMTTIEMRHRDRDEHDEHLYGDRDHAAMRGWYDEHHNNLPPGLARSQLPPGLERQLVRRGTLPPGLQEAHSTLPRGTRAAPGSTPSRMCPRPNRWTPGSAEPQNKCGGGRSPLRNSLTTPAAGAAPLSAKPRLVLGHGRRGGLHAR